MKCGQSTKAEKMALVLAGREDRTFGRKRQKLDPFASTTNKVRIFPCHLMFYCVSY